MKIKVGSGIYTIVPSDVDDVYNILDEDGLNIQSVLGNVALSDVINFVNNYEK